MEAALIAKLLASAGITALVGQRINWKVRPQGQPLPALVLHKPSGFPDYQLSGTEGLWQSRVQVDSWGLSYGAAKAAADAVLATLSGQRFTHAGVRFAGVLMVDERDDTFSAETGTLFRYSRDYQVHHAAAS